LFVLFVGGLPTFLYLHLCCENVASFWPYWFMALQKSSFVAYSKGKAIYILRGKFAKWIIDWNTMAISWQIVGEDNV